MQRPAREANAETPPILPVRLQPDDGRDDEQQGERNAASSVPTDGSESIEQPGPEVLVEIKGTPLDDAPSYRGLGRHKREENPRSFNDLLDIVVGLEG
ncbi:MAG: hypothetical protein QGG40_13040 [Myxococcota bacterium]|nr:hypothetical protein [Myxococcota bacterium]